MGWEAVDADPDPHRRLPWAAACPIATYLTCPTCCLLDRHTEMWLATAEGVVEMDSCRNDRCPHEEGKIRPDLEEALQLTEPEVPKVDRRHRTPASLAARLPEQPKPG
jgi:hypothetical protein